MFSHFLQKSDITEHKLMSGFSRRFQSSVSLSFLGGGEGGGRGKEGTAIRRLPFSTQVHSDWLTSFGQTSVTFKVYPFRRNLRDNQINQLPFGVFNNNLKLTYL